MNIKKDLMEKLMERYEKMVSNEELLPLDKLNEEYSLFRSKFNPNILKNLDGELLIETMFHIGNKDSLSYWLEYKNDDEFKTSMYGGISGGSSFKYIMFKRNLDGKWVTGNPQNPRVLTADEAVELGRKLRDSLVAGAELIEKLGSNISIEEYIKLQNDLDNVLIENMSNLGWVHKYYHMLYPEKIDAFHSIKWQKHILICCRVKPVDDNKLYVMSGQHMEIVKELGLPSAYVMYIMATFFGAPIDYFKIEVSSKEHWEAMKENSHVSIGWLEVGDLKKYEVVKKNEMKKKIEENLKRNSSVDIKNVGSITNQILTFYRNIRPKDIVVAVDGEKVLGIGEVIGDYEYRDNMKWPHCFSTKWLYSYDKDVRLPISKEGLNTYIYRYKNLDNIMFIEKLKKNLTDETNNKVLPRLSGIIGEIQNILNRKKQVILYGPPGTGKSYYAEKSCREIAARKMYQKSFEELSDSEKKSITGDGKTRGLIRICCFHPTYGYEDFIEGIKPVVVNGQVQFRLTDGIFKILCLDAMKEPNKDFFLIIDEINRGDISRIFGELIMLIEVGKRNKEVILPLSNEPFKVPENVYIIGTMNTADRSIALLDVALRRRFGFIELMPDYGLLEGVYFDGLPLAEWLKELNKAIVNNIGKDARNLQIGHSYFMEGEEPIKDIQKFKAVIKEDIIPLLEEYCYGDYNLLANILGQGIVDVKKQQIRHEVFDSSDNFINALLQPWPDLKNVTENNSLDIDEKMDDGGKDEY